MSPPAAPIREKLQRAPKNCSPVMTVIVRLTPELIQAVLLLVVAGLASLMEAGMVEPWLIRTG
jgi:hypothetical protein